MAQWLRTLSAFPEDPGKFPEPTWQLMIICNSSSKGWHPLLAFAGIQHLSSEYTYIHAGKNLDKEIKINLLKRFEIFFKKFQILLVVLGVQSWSGLDTRNPVSDRKLVVESDTTGLSIHQILPWATFNTMISFYFSFFPWPLGRRIHLELF